MNLINRVLDLYSEKKAVWHRGGWWGHGQVQPQVCIMGAIGVVIHQRGLIYTNIDPMHFVRGIMPEVGRRSHPIFEVLTREDRKELRAFHEVLMEQYPEKNWKSSQRDWRHRIGSIISWNDTICKNEEELLRVLEKTTIKLAESE